MRKAQSDPEVKAKVSAGLRAAMADPERGQNMRKGLALGHAASMKRHAQYAEVKTSDTPTAIQAARRAQSKLTQKDVDEIRRRYKPGHATDSGKALAKEFGTSPMNVSRIVRGQMWA
jgi:acyl-CoA reductase-like NAD-dependent aldehyde dehydrogenase